MDRGAPTASGAARSTGPARPVAKAAPSRNNTQAAPVSQDNEWWEEKKEEIQEVLESPFFDIALSVVILLNAVTIGIEQSLEIAGKDTLVIKVIESLFLVLYIVELVLRFLPKGFAVFWDNWVKFDFLLVLLGILQSWIIEPLESDETNFGPLMVLRTTRLFRLAKTMRLFSKVEACWMLVRGFMNSAAIMFYSLMLLFITLYVFACLACEIITKNVMNTTEEDPVFHEQVAKHWSNLPQIMLTLMRFVCLDNMSEVYTVLVEKDPWLSIFFVALILVVSLVLFHLLGAVLFSSVLEQHLAEQEAAKRAKEAEWASLIQDLKKMFLRIDVDGSGTLSREELMNIDPKDNEALTKALGVSTPMQVFNTLDVQKTGQVSIAEFVNIIWDVVLKNTPLELKRMERQVETMDWRVKEMFSLQHDLQMKLGTIVQEVQDVKMCMNSALSPSSNGKSNGHTNGHTNGHANGSNGHAPGTNGLTSNGHKAASYNSGNGQKACAEGNSGGDRGQRPCKSPSKQYPAESTDELIAKLRSTWEESLVFAFEHVRVPVSATRNSSRNSSPAPSLEARGVDGQAVKKAAVGEAARASQRRHSIASIAKDPLMASQVVGNSDEHPSAADGAHHGQRATRSPPPPSAAPPPPAAGVNAQRPSSKEPPTLPDEATVVAQPAGGAGVPQPPPVATRAPMQLLQARQEL